MSKSRPRPYKRPRPSPRLRRRSQALMTTLGIEKKYYDTSKALTAITSPTDATGGELDPATVNALSAPAQGDTDTNRDGRKIVVKSVQVTGLVNVPAQANQTAADTGNVVFIALVQDTQTNGAQLNSEDVFTNPAAAGSTAVTPLRNMLYSSRFKVLATTTLDMTNPALGYDGTNMEQNGLVRTFSFFKKLEMPVSFNSTTTAGVDAVVDNSLHLIAFTNSTALAPQLSYNARIRFVG